MKPIITAEDLKRSARNIEKKIREHTIESYLRKECMLRGALVLKLGTRYKGFPDRCVLWPANILNPSRIDFIELKRPKGGAFESLQIRWHDFLKSMGFNVQVLRTKQEVNIYVSRRKWITNNDTLSLIRRLTK